MQAFHVAQKVKLSFQLSADNAKVKPSVHTVQAFHVVQKVNSSHWLSEKGKVKSIKLSVHAVQAFHVVKKVKSSIRQCPGYTKRMHQKQVP